MHAHGARVEKRTKNRSKSLSHTASHQDRAKISSRGSLGSILEGSGSLLGVSLACLGCSWASLGRSWAPLGRILGASWSLLGAFWLVLGGILALGEAPGWILKASGRVRGAILRLLGLISRCFFDARELALTYRIKGCMNCCRKPMLAFTWAFRFPLQRGGTCEAHPPPTEGQPSVPDRRFKFQTCIP